MPFERVVGGLLENDISINEKLFWISEYPKGLQEYRRGSESLEGARKSFWCPVADREICSDLDFISKICAIRRELNSFEGAPQKYRGWIEF